MKKILAALLAMVLCVSLLAACKPEAEEVSSEVAPTEVTIKTASMFGGTDASADEYAQIVADFDEANEYITVVDESTTSDDAWKAAIASSFETGDNADVVFFFTGTDADPILESCVTIEEIREVYPDYCNWINESAIASCTSSDGKNYAIPVKGFWEALFVNEDLFQANNLALPTDWDKFTGSFEALNAANIIPMAFGSDIPHYWIESFILASGSAADFNVNPGSDVAAVPASWKTGLDYFKKLYDLGGFAKACTSTDYATACEQFINKQAAMSVDGSWWCGSITAPDTTTVIAFPNAPEANKSTIDVLGGFSSGFFISRAAWEDEAKREACVAFVEAAASAESVAAYNNQGGAPACAIEADPNSTTPRPAKDGAAAVGAADSVNTPIEDKIQAFKDAFVPGVSEIINGTKTVDDVVAAFCEANK